MNIVLPTLKDIIAAVVQAAEAGTLEEVLERINRVAQELVNARYAALGVPDGQGGLRYFKTAGMTPEEVARMPHPPEGHGLLGAIMNERQVLRLDQMQDDERSAGFPENHPHMRSLLGVPIQVGQQLFGMLYLSDRRDGQPFTDQDEWLVETLAGYAALAIAGVNLSEQQNRLVLLEERERVAMELHDGTIQSLYAIGMHLQLMRLDDDISSEAVGKAIEELDTVIEDIRGYILNLKVANYQTQTISEAMQDIVVRLRARDCLDVTIQAPDELPVFAPPVF
ncbi:GAF domain-containing protein [bacterium]|nr:GAF domain-containing protein [bacterium]